MSIPANIRRFLTFGLGLYKMEPVIENSLHIQILVGHEQEGTYFTVPFQMPPHTESFTLTYRYEHHREGAMNATGLTPRRRLNIIDLGLIAPNGVQVGA